MLEIIKDQDALQVKISSSNGIPFNHVLDKLKMVIPKEERKWSSAKKCWLLPPKYLDQLNDLNESISSGDLSIEKEELILEIQCLD